MSERDATIKRAFEQPQWYLRKVAFNIRIRAETIRAFTQEKIPASVLDIGCGDGSLSLPLLNHQNRLTLVDRSTSMLEIARSRIPEDAVDRVSILNDDFLLAALPQREFDLVICVGVLAYVEDTRVWFRKLASMLKPGGALIMECTDGGHFITHLIQAYKSMRAMAGGAKFPTIRRPSSELLNLASEFGLRPVQSFRYSLPLPGFRRLLSQGVSYRSIRLIFGAPPRSRAAALGNECLYKLRSTSPEVGSK